MLNREPTVPTPGIWGMAATRFFTRLDSVVEANDHQCRYHDLSRHFTASFGSATH